LIGEFSLFQGGEFGGFLRFDVFERCARGLQTVLLRERIDFGNQLALADFLAQLHMNGLDLAGNLRADIDLLEGFDRARGEHGFFDVGDFDGAGQQGWRRDRALHGDQAGGDRGQRDDANDGAVTGE